jgi:ABC-type multidrug transport system ATPase subunit
MIPAVSLQNVTRIFSARFALRRIDLEIGDGEAVAVTGSNGSGKTTLLRMISTLLRPSSGEIRVFGKNPAEEAAAIRPKIGVLFTEAYLYPDLTVRENLAFHARIHRVAAEPTITRWLDRMNLRRLENDPVRHLSKGERQRTALVRSMLHEPSLLLWDEPTSGLDDRGRDLFREIAAESKGKRTILCATHDIESILGWTNRRLALEEGRIR